VVKASYGGDENNFGSLKTHSLNIKPPTSTATRLENGGAFVDQTSETGVNVTISGSTSPNGTRVVINSSDLGSYQPTGTGSTGLNGTKIFYDVSVQGISTGSAKVCISNPAVNSFFVMKYWNANLTIWVNAGSQTITGTVICGVIPVPDLDGTPIVVGTS